MYRDLIVLGSSSSEVFDYIFGDNPQYHPFWASGWSARGLTNQHNLNYIANIINKTDISRSANIFLNFGNADVDFNLRHKVCHENFQDYDIFLQQMTVGILCLKNHLIRLGFDENRIFATFVSPPVRLEQEYWWWLHDNKGQLPTSIRGSLLWKCSKILEQDMKVINLLKILSDNFKYGYEKDFYPALSIKYMRDKPDHHANYIKTQEIVWKGIEMIDGIIPKRANFLEELYQHEIFDIRPLRDKGKPRPRTCQ